MHTVRTANFRVTGVDPLPAPARIRDEIPVPLAAQQVVDQTRHDITTINEGEDDRLVVVTGPCSVHDPDAALAYAERLAHLAQEVSDQLLVVMRVYVEKPRTRLGWKGLVSDPRLDGSHDIHSGLRLARSLMVRILDTGLPVGCEFLDPAIPRYLSDAVSWASIGARTVQSQVHRQFASGLSMPVGLKNSTTGSVEDAIDAIVAAGSGHVFPGIDDDGAAAVLTTSGNPDCHIVLRGSSAGPNYGAVHVAKTLDLLEAAGLRRSLFIDASHGNSGKDHNRQPQVVADLAGRIGEGESGITGVMLESFLAAGRQDLGRADRLSYGQSVTDACVGWGQTVHMISELADAVASRRSSPAHLSLVS
ncbi:3-deoxy-7-phosphoheptulonate synthase [Amycolatopsis cihanbeyliensis]|uniref:Phospho-2-dehydro-3-deoxyheptonate aldolase n=1 Tax=Amycolatopsis cihanbeyliensis TaxID=1128664 RepID=A0A542DPW2_AMYCI|nr:3-deoxy-7-phosphoheptulonate synthase [Amycolatopsis cihanbeyliensis]TQJ05141.1 3-deoxy-D-arabinoheptulosonate-7-phosphate synthase [Amycolatopsis cihanbeyliensis]